MLYSGILLWVTPGDFALANAERQTILLVKGRHLGQEKAKSEAKNAGADQCSSDKRGADFPGGALVCYQRG